MHLIVNNKLYFGNRKPSICNNSVFFRPRTFSEGISDQVRTPSYSRKRKILKFSTDEQLRGSYMNPLGKIRVGLILEELDSMAGMVAYRHTSNPETAEIVDRILTPRNHPFQPFHGGLVIVTAGVDRIELTDRIPIDSDVIVEGSVTWCGRSSMEVRITVDSMIGETKERKLDSFFTMVARDPQNKPIPVAKLQPETDEEKLLFQQGSENAQRRKHDAKHSLLQTPPTDEERKLIHDLFLKSNKGSSRVITPSPSSLHFLLDNDPIDREIDDSVFSWMRSNRLQSAILMQPQERNIHNKIFGGYLMRKAFELAWSAAYLFTGTPNKLVAVDDISFLAPVEIGDIVSFSGEVSYSNPEEKLVQVSVAADVINPSTKTMKTTNVFHFTHRVQKDANVKQVIPYSYEETLRFINGRRITMKLPVKN